MYRPLKLSSLNGTALVRDASRISSNLSLEYQCTLPGFSCVLVDEETGLLQTTHGKIGYRWWQEAGKIILSPLGSGECHMHPFDALADASFHRVAGDWQSSHRAQGELTAAIASCRAVVDVVGWCFVDSNLIPDWVRRMGAPEPKAKEERDWHLSQEADDLIMLCLWLLGESKTKEGINSYHVKLALSLQGSLISLVSALNWYRVSILLKAPRDTLEIKQNTVPHIWDWDHVFPMPWSGDGVELCDKARDWQIAAAEAATAWEQHLEALDERMKKVGHDPCMPTSSAF